MISAGLAILAFGFIALPAIFLVWQTHVWCSWMIIAGAELPCALGWSVLTYTKTLAHEKEVLEIKLTSATSASPNPPPGLAVTPEGTRLTPLVQHHILSRSIGLVCY